MDYPLSDRHRILIAAVKCFPELYDPSDRGYSDRVKQGEAWENVAENVGVSVEQVRSSWHNLRSTLRRSILSNNRRTWYLQNEMEFIIPYMRKHKDFIIEENESEDSEAIPKIGETREMNKNLIAAVKCYPGLYDPAQEEYNHRSKQNPIWQKVAENVGISVDQAKKCWHGLRSSFRRSLASYYDKSKKRKWHPWYLQDEMDFLLPFIQKDFMFDEAPIQDPNNLNPVNFLEIVQNPISSDANSSNSVIKPAQGNVGIILVPAAHASLIANPESESGLQLEDNPELSFFYSALPDVTKLNEANKRKLKISLMTKVNNLLQEQQNSHVK